MAINENPVLPWVREAARKEGLNMRATAAALKGADSSYLGGAQSAGR